MQDVFGQALAAYFYHRTDDRLYLHTSYGPIEEMPLDEFFRDNADLTELELIALALCDGKVLDIGAGAGSHSLYLQQHNFDVHSLEISPLACQVMKDRHVKRIIEADVFNYQDERYDTLLLLMNGIGLIQELDKFVPFLDHAKNLLNDGGQLLFDSSDISYLYNEGLQRPNHYYGEVRFKYEFRGVKGTPFGWVYIDQETLIDYAKSAGWVAQVLYEDENDQYLVRLSIP